MPGRVAVAGFNDLTGSDQMQPALTTVRTPRMRLALMRGQTVARTSVDLGFELVLRASA